MPKSAFLLSALGLLAGCAATTTPPPRQQPVPDVMSEPTAHLIHARIGETVSVDGPKVTPLVVLEDSRCPMNARCVWAGRVRIKARIDLGSGSQVRELTQGAPVQVADGSLELVEVQPDRPMTNEPNLAPADYRFGFRFMGGI